MSVAPVLSTPETHVFEDPTPPVDTSKLPVLSDDQLYVTYEIHRTVNEIEAGKWRRIALQFPDEMLVDAPRLFDALQNDLRKSKNHPRRVLQDQGNDAQDGVAELNQSLEQTTLGDSNRQAEARLCILADTSYGACCVDEVAAEHVDADVVVHYGRTCLSPTARLPVIYVFTSRPLDVDAVIQSFQEAHPDKADKVILMADIPYSVHVQSTFRRLQEAGYSKIYPTEIIHNPSSPLPNRSIPQEAESDVAALQSYSLFHISEPPTSLLLNISSRLSSIHIFPTDSTNTQAISVSTAQTLRRRYALVTKLSTVSIFGILINTLSVKNYMSALSHVQDLIARSGKKAYTFVVGKVNAAKVANFSEVDGWVVIGCWESSLIESKDFWKPIITPFELELALTDERDRIWTGEWNSDFQSLLGKSEQRPVLNDADSESGQEEEEEEAGEEASDDEDSEPPVFDLRTGRYVSQSRPMARPAKSKTKQAKATSSLVKRANGDLAQIGGQVSPAAEFLRSKRTWQGLGSDYNIAYEHDEEGKVKGAQMEEGRSGVARGYNVGQQGNVH